ncbi:hypothetical protein A3J15_00180 [Candidatus Roizmanbacteria bacterium RIFCSPLOWO2_02_FULL_38_10]|uniref:Nudix hydrolase domain-containing protein n=1 Tax=Candidatus Roizmanbacteria bacterium RIFCSPLOWO2_02_FULL_38_10 TaxID=1802074 RepID=A0A1F7JNG3_9BACT|nr:MAG: hypothetical protein A3J15_00180 [Candidatus Roizmanbacteria bacterium RIFCSPLOWO2_02_FULL_38_10]
MKRTIKIVVIGIIKKQNLYLLTKRRDKKSTKSPYHGLWQLPGGELEFGESVTHALTREIQEELGIQIEVVSILPTIRHQVRNNSWHGVFICFLCRMRNEKEPIKLNHEASEFNWFTLDQVRKLNKLYLTDQMVEEAESGVNQPR